MALSENSKVGQSKQSQGLLDCEWIFAGPSKALAVQTRFPLSGDCGCTENRPIYFKRWSLNTAMHHTAVPLPYISSKLRHSVPYLFRVSGLHVSINHCLQTEGVVALVNMNVRFSESFFSTSKLGQAAIRYRNTKLLGFEQASGTGPVNKVIVEGLFTEQSSSVQWAKRQQV